LCPIAFEKKYYEENHIIIFSRWPNNNPHHVVLQMSSLWVFLLSFEYVIFSHHLLVVIAFVVFFLLRFDMVVPQRYLAFSFTSSHLLMFLTMLSVPTKSLIATT